MDTKVDIKVKLSLMWIVIMINMLFNDIFSIMIEFVKGDAIAIPGDVYVVMAAAAVITNIPIFMILLSRVLKYKANRIANISAGIFTALYVIAGGSATPHYIIIGAIEVVLAIIIVVTAWRWKEEDANA